MRLLLLVALLFCLVPAPAHAAENPGWTGNAELDRAFVYNNAGRYAEAFALFSTLHEQGVPMAGTMAGRYYEDGRAVGKDRGKALVLSEFLFLYNNLNLFNKKYL